MNKHIRHLAFAAVLSGALMLSACSPSQNAVDDRISVVREKTTAEYLMTTAQKGDITLTENIRVKYFSAQEENCGFGVSGPYYDSFSVSVGDEVKAGDVLAALDCTELDQQIARLEAESGDLARELERNRQLLDLFDSRTEGRDLSAEDMNNRRTYEVAIRNCEDELTLAGQTLDELLAQRTERVIIAPMAGTVTFLRSVEPGETSTKGKVVVTITNFDSCAFSASVEHPEALEEGEIYTVSIEGTLCEITPASAESLGIEPEPMNAASELTRVYFRPLTPGANLSADASGTFSVEVESRSDVVCIPANALAYVDGLPCVYVPNAETGLAEVRPVHIGLVTPQRVEILDGLEAGESIILY